MLQHFDINDKLTIQRSPLASKLFTIDGVAGVFLGRDFITVTKSAADPWHLMKPIIFSHILDFISEGKPAVLDKPVVSDTAILENGVSIEIQLKYS